MIKINYNFVIQSSLYGSNYHKDLSHIRHMMERSTRFLSLSGMSGIVTGVIALLGAAYAYNYLGTSGFDYEGRSLHTVEDKVTHLIIVALIVLVSAIFSEDYLRRNIKKSGQPFWTMATKKLLFNFCIPGIRWSILYWSDYSSVLYTVSTYDVVRIWSGIV